MPGAAPGPAGPEPRQGAPGFPGHDPTAPVTCVTCAGYWGRGAGGDGGQARGRGQPRSGEGVVPRPQAAPKGSSVPSASEQDKGFSDASAPGVNFFPGAVYTENGQEQK